MWRSSAADEGRRRSHRLDDDAISERFDDLDCCAAFDKIALRNDVDQFVAKASLSSRRQSRRRHSMSANQMAEVGGRFAVRQIFDFFFRWRNKHDSPQRRRMR